MAPEVEAMLALVGQLANDIETIKYQLTALPKDPGHICGSIPAIPMEDWYVSQEPQYSDRSTVWCNGTKIMEVLHNEDFPELPAFLGHARLYWHYLREIVLMFQRHGTAQLGELSAVFYLNGRPVAPDMVADYRAASAALSAVRPLPGPPTTPQAAIDEVRFGLGPVELSTDDRPRFSVWQTNDAAYHIAETAPIDPETGEPARYVGGLLLKSSHQSKVGL